MQWPFVKRSTYDEACEAAREHNLRANRAEMAQAAMKRLGLQWKRRAEIAEARYQPLMDELIRRVSLTPPAPLVLSQADGAMIPDPPSVRDNDTKVAVAMRDREAGPLKRALRPGEDE